jgi:hypothetical protein
MAIISYSREASGVFVFEMLAPDTSLADGLLDFLPAVDGVSDVFLRSIEVGTDSGIVRIIIELNINAGG